MAGLSAADENLRGILTRLIADLGHDPGEEQLAVAVGLPLGEVRSGLRRLADAHALLLHPNSTRPWAVHPFALAPGSCWVETAWKGYWANCLYCAFGIAAALKCDAVITTRYGGEAETVSYHVENKHVFPGTDLFHLSTPPRLWWDNVIFACSSFQPFQSDSEIGDWVERRTIFRGARS